MENGERRTENGEDNTPRPSATPLQEGRADAESGELEDNTDEWVFE
ncbi:MAG: hypothetical protein J6T88_00190 [Bacteroidales bacterium]|nr:hypothetical protein [Bacteroidales bacterium]